MKKTKIDGKFSLPFRYTDDISRINLIEEIYPISNLLIESISNIPWEDYEFIGPTQCSIQDDEESDYFTEKKDNRNPTIRDPVSPIKILFFSE